MKVMSVGGCSNDAEDSAKLDELICTGDAVPSVQIDSHIGARLDSLDRFTFPKMHELNEMYRLTVLDWEEGEWELASVNSNLMMDEFVERPD